LVLALCSPNRFLGTALASCLLPVPVREQFGRNVLDSLAVVARYRLDALLFDLLQAW
jgi:hypothetical protein